MSGRYRQSQSWSTIALYGVIAILVVFALITLLMSGTDLPKIGVVAALVAVTLLLARSYRSQLHSGDVGHEIFEREKQLRHEFADQRRELHRESMEMIDIFNRRTQRHHDEIARLKAQLSLLNQSISGGVGDGVAVVTQMASVAPQSETRGRTGTDEVECKTVPIAAVVEGAPAPAVECVAEFPQQSEPVQVRDEIVENREDDSRSQQSVARERVGYVPQALVVNYTPASVEPASVREAKLFAQVGELMKDNARINAKNLVLTREVAALTEKLATTMKILGVDTYDDISDESTVVVRRGYETGRTRSDENGHDKPADVVPINRVVAN